MSVANCLLRLRAEGKITPEAAQAADALWRRYQDKFSLDLPPAQANAAAALQAARMLSQTSREKRLQVAKQTARQTEAEREQFAHPWGPAAGGMSVLVRDIYRVGGQNVETRAQTLREALYARFNAGLEHYGSRLAGLKQDVAGARNMVRELFGVDTGDQVAKAAAHGWQDATKFGTDYVRQAGKIFEPAEDWRLPQAWNSDRVRRFGADEFVADVKRAMESGGLQVFDKERFQVATDPARIDALLAKAARDIITEAGSAPVFSREMRTFLFQDGGPGADAWLALQAKYGAGQDIMATLRGHLNGMATESALVDVLGPNHQATAELLATNARAAERLGEAGSSWRPQRWLGLESGKAVERAYNVLSGRANGVESAAIAGFFGSLRSLVAGSSLGAAIIPAIIGDSVTTLLAARWNGMSFGSVIGRVFERGLSQEDAARLLVTGHALSDSAISTARYADQLVGSSTIRKVADTVIRASGLQLWTERLKQAFTLDMLGFAAKQVGRDFAAVDQPFRDFLVRSRISAAEWEGLRARPLQDVGGAKFFDSSMATEDEAVRKLYEGILTERAYAVLEPDARVRGVTTAGTQAGTIIGEVARNLTMFTSFSQTMIATHVMRIASQDGSMGVKALNGAAFLILHIAAGAVIVQARQVLAGRDPVDMSQPKFWNMASAAGGGLGYFGDLVSNAVESSDRSIIGKFSGPVGGLVDDTGRALHTLATKGRAGVGKLIDVAHEITPGRNLWFARLALDRLVFDKLHRAFDPDATNGFARREENARKNLSQRYWYRPGATSPERGPDLGAALGR